MKRILVRQVNIAHFVIEDPTPDEITACEEMDHAAVDALIERRSLSGMDGEYLTDATVIDVDTRDELDERVDALTKVSAYQRDMIRDNGHFELATALSDLDKFDAQSERDQGFDSGDAVALINRVRVTLRQYVHGK